MGSLKHLRTLIPEDLSAERIARMWRVVEAAEGAASKAQRRRTWAVLVGAATAAFIAAFAVIWMMQSPAKEVDAPGPLHGPDGRAVPLRFAATRETDQRFSDGSSLRLSQGSALRLDENSAAAVSFSLTGGWVRFDIRPGGPRKWTVRSGGVTVTVLGTCFTVERKGEETTVEVERGKVRVRDDEAAKDHTLTAGQSITIGRASDDEAPRPSVAVLDAPQLPEEKDASSAPPEKPEAGRADWRVHAEAGDFDEAYAELGAEGLAKLTRKTTSINELFKLADVARLSGHPAAAESPLLTIVEDFSTDSRAGLAAYTLAKLYLEPLSSPQKASRTFDRAIELGLPKVLLEAAYFKKSEALFQISRPLGEWAAGEYLKRYPDGRYRKQLESRLNDAMTTDK